MALSSIDSSLPVCLFVSIYLSISVSVSSLHIMCHPLGTFQKLDLHIHCNLWKLYTVYM